MRCTPQSTAAFPPAPPPPPPPAPAALRFPASSLVFMCKRCLRITVFSQQLVRVATLHPRRFPHPLLSPPGRRASGLPRPHQETAGINFTRPRRGKQTPPSPGDRDPVDFGWIGGGGAGGRTGGGKFRCQGPSLHHSPKDAHGARAKLLGQDCTEKGGGGGEPALNELTEARRGSQTRLHSCLQPGLALEYVPPPAERFRLTYSRVPTETEALPEQEGAGAPCSPPRSPRRAAEAAATDPLNAVSPALSPAWGCRMVYRGTASC